MKRDRDRCAAAEKGKMCAEHHPDSGMDELFAVLGYKVKSSDMADVAQKLEQLEMAMGNTTMEDGVSVLSAADTVHYNPSDLSGWVESMLSELSNSWNSFDINPNQIGIPGESSSTSFIEGERKFICDDDLRAIPGGAIFRNNLKDADDDDAENRNNNINNDDDDMTKNKKMKSEENGSGPGTEQRAVVLLDSQETGVRLVHTLMACAEAVQQGNLKLADALVKQVGILAVSQVGAMRKVATYFGEALARKIYEIHPHQDPLEWDALQMHFYETGPYLKFAHFTSNQAILEAFTGATHVHVIDFSLKQGMQWPALMQALALQHGGPPLFRLTGVELAQLSGKRDGGLEQVGWKLAQFAGTIGVQFKFQTIVAESLADLNAKMHEISPSENEHETVAVSSVLELHRLLARPGAIDGVLRSIRDMNPKIVTIVEQEANHNGSVFLDRFNEALHYYSTMFDSLEISRGTMGQEQDLLMTEVYLGKQICNVVACEGEERVERHETLAQWRVRVRSAGFQPLHLGSNAFKQASMLLALSASGDGYRVDENDGCLMLGWHTRPLIATSAWQLAAAK